MLHKKITLLASIILFATLCSPIFAQEKTKESPILGDWKGALSVGEQEIPLVFHFKMNDKKELISTMDSPLQNAFDIAMGKVVLKEKKYTINATAIPAKYEGQLKNDSTLIGKWIQNGAEFELILKKQTKKKKEKK